jgi:glycosyltransferase involved in cell wall biosynthesis
MATKEICIYPQFRPTDGGGVAVHIRTLARHLTKRGWTIVAEPGPETLVHCHAQARAPVVNVFTCHGILPLAERMPRWQQEVNAAIFENLKLANEIIAVSKWTAAQWQHLIGRQPHIIYNGVDMADWRKVPVGRWRGTLKIAPATPLVVWGKTSLNALLDPTPLLELALCYPTWRFVAPLPLRSLPTAPANLTCVGAQPFEAMQMLLQDADVYLATVQENHSIQVCEAMALAKPILGYDWAGTAETVTEGGVLVKPRDLPALVAALPEVYAQRNTLGQAGQAHVAANFALSKQIDQLEEVYDVARAAYWRNTERTPIKCSIVIPVYNKPQWVEAAINSACAQINAPRHEVVIVDDGSTDDSLLVARRAALNRPTPTHVYTQANAGVSAARNFGISLAKGEYICCLDGDDVLDLHFLQRLSAALDADPGLGIAYSDFIAFGNDANGMPYEAPITCSEYDFERLKRGNFLPCANLFRKVAWQRAGGYKPINPSWEDYELWLNMGKLGWYGQRVPGMLFKYRKIAKVGRDYESHGHEMRLRATVNKYHRDMYPPTVSVVIPCYQHSRFLRDAIDSVVAQTFPDWEVLVVDDGNEDEEADAIREIVASYANDDMRIVRLNENGKLAAARNAGIELARGQWIVPLDADDKIAPTFLEQAFKAISQEAPFNPQRFAYCDTLLWWPDAETPTKLLEAHGYDFDESLARITWSCTILYAKSAWQAVGGYKPQMSEAGGWEDWEFAINLGANGICGVRIPEGLFYYRQHSDQQMRVKAEEYKARLRETMRRIHARLYEGERTQMCCGAGKKRSQPVVAQTLPPTRAIPVQTRSLPQPTAADVLIRYVGNRMGTQSWTPPSGRRYQFGGIAPVQRVLAEDADFFLSHRDFRRVTA